MQNFAKDTGDFTSISEVDTQVIALGVRMAHLKDEHALLKQEPCALTEFRPKNFNEAYQNKFDDEQSSNDDEDDEDSDSSDEASGNKKAAGDDDDEWNSVAESRQTKRTRERKADKLAHYMKKYGDKRAAAQKEAKLIEMTNPEDDEEGNDNIDNEEDGGEWVTEENLHKHLAHGLMVPIVPVEREEGAELRPEADPKALGITLGAEGEAEE